MSALGIYLAVSLIFIIGTLIEFALVMTIKRMNDLKQPTMVQPCKQLKLSKLIRKLPAGKESMLPPDLKRNPIDQSRGASSFNNYNTNRSKTDTIDFISFILFFGFYIAFTFIYALHYMS